ncbi:MAG: 8-oxoguanine deaminase [bacterium]
MSILIQNPLHVATMDDAGTEFSGGHILVENGVISSIGANPLDVAADEIIAADGMVVIPGLVNTHHHLYQSLTRNIPRMQDASLFDWLVNHYEVWRELTGEAVRVSATTALLEMMKSGVTTSSDHLYLFPHRAEKTLIDAEIASAHLLGLRFQPTRGSMTLGKSQGGLPPDDVVQSEEEILLDTERLLKQYHDESEGSMVRISLAPCSPFSVTSQQLKNTADFARANGLRVHTHTAETLDEETFCLKTYGKRPVEYLDSLGWIDSNTWHAHAVHLNDDEILRMGEVHAGVAHCPDSNMRLGSGIARVREMLDAGVAVGLGVDGSASNDSSNLLTGARNAMMISRLRERDYWLTARDVLRIATRGGAEALGRSDIGQLVAGKRADLALFNVQGIEYAGGMSDPLAALVFSVRMSPVDWLIVEGEIRIRRGRSDVDERALVQRHNQIADEMLRHAGKNSGIDFLARVQD